VFASVNFFFFSLWCRFHATLPSFSISSSLSLFLSLYASLSFLFSLSLSSSVCTASPLRYSFSLLSRSIACRGRGDAATPCPSIPLRLAIRGSQPWSKYFVISLPERDSRNGRTTVAAGSTPPLFAYIIDYLDDSYGINTRRHRSADLDAFELNIILSMDRRTLCAIPDTFIASGFFGFLLRLNFTIVGFRTISLVSFKGNIMWTRINSVNINSQLIVFFIFEICSSSSLVGHASIVSKTTCRYFLFYICINLKSLFLLWRD